MNWQTCRCKAELCIQIRLTWTNYTFINDNSFGSKNNIKETTLRLRDHEQDQNCNSSFPFVTLLQWFRQYWYRSANGRSLNALTIEGQRVSLEQDAFDSMQIKISRYNVRPLQEKNVFYLNFVYSPWEHLKKKSRRRLTKGKVPWAQNEWYDESAKQIESTWTSCHDVKNLNNHL